MAEIPIKKLSIINSTDLITLFDRLDPSKFSNIDSAKNVYRVKLDGTVVWQVHSSFDSKGDPFTNIEIDEFNEILGFRWNGGQYHIDLETGYAQPRTLLK